MTTKREQDAHDDLIAKQNLIVDQREANARMVSATILAHELADEADAAKERAEETRRALRAVAEFREMFIGVVGHDLRAPLASIVVSAGTLLQRGRLDDNDAEAVAGSRSMNQTRSVLRGGEAQSTNRRCSTGTSSE
jgi:signal transduction histidine kinase